MEKIYLAKIYQPQKSELYTIDKKTCVQISSQAEVKCEQPYTKVICKFPLNNLQNV
jgi:hypothetical protein